MERTFIDPHTLELGLRALKMVAIADGEFDLRERTLLEAAAKALRRDDAELLDVEALAEINPEQLAEAIDDELTRTRIVQAQLIMAMMDGDVDQSEYETVRRFAAGLGVDEPRLKNLQQLMNHHYWLLKMDLNRHSAMVGDAVRHAYRVAGLRGAWKASAPFLSKKLAIDEDLAWRYRRLGLLPEDHFGRLYWAHMRERHFAFPGEPGGFSEEFIKHDLCHVLGDYDTDPIGECEVVAFICGFMRADPFWYLFMIATHMHLGIEVFQGNPLGKHEFEPERVLAALERGSTVERDLYVPGLDWWAYLERPIDEVRAELGIVPKSA